MSALGDNWCGDVAQFTGNQWCGQWGEATLNLLVSITHQDWEGPRIQQKRRSVWEGDINNWQNVTALQKCQGIKVGVWENRKCEEHVWAERGWAVLLGGRQWWAWHTASPPCSQDALPWHPVPCSPPLPSLAQACPPGWDGIPSGQYGRWLWFPLVGTACIPPSPWMWVRPVIRTWCATKRREATDIMKVPNQLILS